MHFDPLSYYTANPFIPHVNKRVMIFSKLNNTSLTNTLDDITFGKPKKTNYKKQIIQISQFYGIFFSSSIFNETHFLRRIVNICTIESEEIGLRSPTDNLHKCMMI